MEETSMNSSGCDSTGSYDQQLHCRLERQSQRWRANRLFEKRVQKLLVVDDDQQIREIISHFLTIQGYHVAQADNGTQALKKCFEENFDVVVTDFQLPGMNGLSLTHRIHSVVPETPVIVMSAHDSIGKNKALNVGAADFIEKPFVIQELLAKIRMVLATET